MSDLNAETYAGAPGAPRITDFPITVYLGRAGFVAGVNRILNAQHIPCAVLHVRLCVPRDCAGFDARRILNLAGSTLLRGMTAGAVAYLGNGEFAVFLQDADDRDAAAFARATAETLATVPLWGEGEGPLLDAHIGGVMTHDCGDASVLLKLADAAGGTAQFVMGGRVQLLSRPEDFPRLPWLTSLSTH